MKNSMPWKILYFLIHTMKNLQLLEEITKDIVIDPILYENTSVEEFLDM